jgi:hypothetical protein
MRSFAVQSIEIHAPYDKVFTYIADDSNLPEWTNAFKEVQGNMATMQTENGSIQVKLDNRTSRETGVIDSVMTFPDDSVGTAYSRVIRIADDRTIYSFVLMAPPDANAPIRF